MKEIQNLMQLDNVSNILQALNNLSKISLENLKELYSGSNRINNQGEALEALIKDIFSNCKNQDSQIIKEEFYSNVFSYLGNQNNPPDLILKNGDAIEVKKIENSSTIALNSSYPKNKLHSLDSRITKACRECENGSWDTKDIIYAIGKLNSKSKKLEVLWFVYGDCYAASSEIYERIASSIKNAIAEQPDIEFIKTNELAKVNKVDPLGITDLRVRGMWHIRSPIYVFESIFSEYDSEASTIVCIMKIEKYESFDSNIRKELESNSTISIRSVKIKSPDNPAVRMDCKLIYFYI